MSPTVAGCEYAAIRAPAKAYTKNLQALLSSSGCRIAEEVNADLAIADLTVDSRAVRPGAAFVALAGRHAHGIEFARQAAHAGARAILWEPSEAVRAPRLPAGTCLIGVPGLSSALGGIADRFFDSPSAQLCVTGITGTNGKTTTAHVLAQALANLGEAAAYAGTLGVQRMGVQRMNLEAAGGEADAGSRQLYSPLTTPDCITVHRRLAALRDAGVRFVAMEVSSHALDQQRVAGVRFDSAVFTNLTRDHLDYHGSLAAYGAAKARLFSSPGLRHAVINVDDDFGRGLSMPASSARRVLYGRRPTGAPAAGFTTNSALPPYRASTSAMAGAAQELFAYRVSAESSGLAISVDGSWGVHDLRCRLIGDFNVENLLAALGSLLAWQIPAIEAIAALEQCTAPPGRMELLGAAGQVKAIVDYAHTPAALEKALRAARGHCTGVLTCIFGCGGERDAGKRPLMARAAESLADVIIITDDNPRGEDGDAIIADIMRGFARPDEAVVERNRAAAITKALLGGSAGDVVLIAGKGHEDYQLIGTQRHCLSDRKVACAALGLDDIAASNASRTGISRGGHSRLGRSGSKSRGRS